MKKLFFTFVTIGVLVTNLFGSGFQINEHGAKALGMGGAFTAVANNASAAYFNGAGVTQLRGMHLSVGATYIAPLSKFTGPYPSRKESELKKNFFTPINFHFTKQLSKKLYLGFTVNNPFGLGTEWNDSWVGRYSAVKTDIKTLTFTPIIAYKFSEKFSASVGFSYSYASVIINRKLQGLLPNPAGGLLKFRDVTFEVEGNDYSLGFNVALLYKPTKEFSIGVAFKSQIKYDMSGDAKLEYANGTSEGIKQIGNKVFPSGDVTAPLTTPMVISTGLAYSFFNKLTLAADFQYNGWSSYDKLELTFSQWKNLKTGSNVSTSHREFEDSYILRFGGEYKLNKKVDIRAGFTFDKNPVKNERLDPTLPDADRISLSCGFGYKFTEKLSIDFAYFYLHFVERTINNSLEFIPIQPNPVALNGTYNSSAHLIGLNLNYSL